MPFQRFSEITPEILQLSERCLKNGKIDPGLYAKYDVKRGLRDLNGKGVLAGLTEIANVQAYDVVDGESVPCEGKLFYRGFNIADLVKGFLKDKRFGFEEATYLLLFGELPDERELKDFQALLANYRTLPTAFVRDIIMKAPSPDMMNTLARSVLTLYSYDENSNDISIPNVLRQCLQLIALFPLISVYGYQAYRHYHDGQSLFIHMPQPDLSTAENILYCLRADSKYTELEAKILDLALVLHAEHGGGNNSTFTTHVVTSSGTDTYSAIAAALGSLKGPKHGGANIKVAEMVEYIKQGVEDITDADQVADFLKKILRKEAGDGSGLIYGMGHAVYTLSDPRAVILKEHARKFAENTELEDEFKLLELIETLTPNILEELRGDKKVMCANVDLYSGLVYKLLGIPEDLFTPLFTVARVAGWSAHRMEELMTGGKIIRPAYKSVCAQRKYVRLDERLDSYPGELKYIPSDERA